MKIRSAGAELFHADGPTARRAGMTRLIVAFRNFANPSGTIIGQGRILNARVVAYLNTNKYLLGQR